MKMRKFADEGFVREGKNESIDEETRARAMASVNKDPLGDFIKSRGLDRVSVNEVADDEKVVTDDRIARTSPAAAPKAKPAIVTLQQLNAFKAKYGADKDLTDYRNVEAGGLKRRNAPPPSAPSAPPPSVSGKRETTTEDVFPVLTGEKKRAEEKMDKKQAKAEANAQLIAKVKAGKDPRAILYPYSSTPGIEHAKPKEKETRTPKRSGNLTDMLGLSSRYASGGAVSASRRGDGIAQRGKTRGKMC